jgi:hypothetical protein
LVFVKRQVERREFDRSKVQGSGEDTFDFCDDVVVREGKGNICFTKRNGNAHKIGLDLAC